MNTPENVGQDSSITPPTRLMDATKQETPIPKKRARTTTQKVFLALSCAAIAAGAVLLGMYIVNTFLPNLQNAQDSKTLVLEEKAVWKEIPEEQNWQTTIPADTTESTPGVGATIGVLSAEKFGDSWQIPVTEGDDSETLLSEVTADWVPTSTPLGPKPGNTVIAGHRGDATFGVFYKVGELTPEDLVYIETETSIYRYKVSGTQIVPPTATEVMNETPNTKEKNTDKHYLTLISCEFISIQEGDHRIVVLAEFDGYLEK